jgi:hypothetical protein
MICPNCGTRLGTGITHCHFCGIDIFQLSNEKEGDHENKSDGSYNAQLLFLTKFIALFTTIAVLISISFFFYTVGSNVFKYKIFSFFLSIIVGSILTFFYLKYSPFFIKEIVDDIKPMNQQQMQQSSKERDIILIVVVIVIVVMILVFGDNFIQYLLR